MNHITVLQKGKASAKTTQSNWGAYMNRNSKPVSMFKENVVDLLNMFQS